MWTPTKKIKYGVAIYNFDGKVKHGLPLNIGDTVQILEECAGWYCGFANNNRTNKGIFPVSYIHPKDWKVDVEGPNETVTPIEDPVVKEVAYVLREWSIIWKKMFVMQKEQFHSIGTVMLDLRDMRKELVSSTLTHEQARDLKAKIISKIDWGNTQLGIDLVPRVEMEQVDVEKVSPVELFRIHEQSVANVNEASSRGSLRIRRHSQRVVTHHLCLTFIHFGVNVGETTEVHFELFDSKENRSFSERYVSTLSDKGMPINIEKLHNNNVLFTDLGNKDLIRDSYLVAKIFRIGAMKEQEHKRNTPSTLYKRPYGCAALSIKEVLQGSVPEEPGIDQEYRMKVFTCNENDFAVLHENIIRKQSNKFSMTSAQFDCMTVGLRMFHGDLEQVKKEEAVLFRHIAVARKLGFPDVIMPGDVRNDLYVTLERGDFEKGSKKAAKNVEMRAMVIDEHGAMIEDCISRSAGETSVKFYNTHIFYHSNCPRWSDTIRLTMPIDAFDGAHIRLEFRHCSTRDKTEKRLFAFAFVKLKSKDGTTIKDGSHELYLYKCDDPSKLRHIESYLPSLPSSPADIDPKCGTTQGNILFRRSEREFVYIDTLLCSTKLTQNAALLGLLKWRLTPHQLDAHLDHLLRLDGEEVVKYLQDILDVLFSMFTAPESAGARLQQGQAHAVFRALVHICSLLESRKFEHFKAVFDVYIANHFSAVLVSRDLLMCVKETLEFVEQTEKQDYLQRCFNVLPYIGKCIVQARLLQTRQFGGEDTSSFHQVLRDVFDVIVDVMSLTIPNVLTTQEILLANIPSFFSELSKVCPSAEVSKAFHRMFQQMPPDNNDLVITKLKCLKDIVNSGLFNCPDSKAILLPVCVKVIERQLKIQNQMKLCVAILGDILNTLHSDNQQGLPSFENIQVLLSLLEQMVHTTLRMDRGNKNRGAMVGCLVAMLKLMEEQHYNIVLEDFKDRKRLKDFLRTSLDLFHSLVKHTVFPSDWMVMKMTVNSVVLHTLQFVALTLTSTFLDDYDFDNDLWSRYFHLAVSFLTQPCLQLELFSDAKRNKVHERYGDMRVRMGYEILAMWSNLGEKKLHFIPAMVGPFLQVTLVPEQELRQAVIPIFFDMMQCEQNANGNFKQVERELIDKLDILVSENKGDKQYSHLFNTILLRKVQSETSWQENGKTFIHSVTMLLERLLDYRNVLEGDENREQRMTCTVNLLNFYKNEIKRHEMYIRYIYKLTNLHVEALNYTEAAFTLLLHAQLLDFSSFTMVPEDEMYPAMPEWQKKEVIYHQVINYFDVGKSWEYGIPLCKELATLYEKTINYSKLSENLQLQASFYDKILHELRPEPEYFKVGFFGQNLPMFLRNKEYIFRGLEYEKLGDFTSRLKCQFPAATILTTEPTDNIKQGNHICLQIYSVTPVPEGLAIQPYLAQDVPENIRTFYKVNNVDTFEFDRPFHRGERDKENEFKTLYLERTTLHTADKLPGILRWFEVDPARTKRQTLSPIEVAIDSIENKNGDIRDLVTAYSRDLQRSLEPLTRTLNGVIDAAVNGGITKYQQAFFTSEFGATFPQYEHHVKTLKTVIIEQVHLLDGALNLHGRLVSPTLKPLHDKLAELFSVMKEGLKESGSPSMIRLFSASDQLTIVNGGGGGDRRASSYSNHSSQSTLSTHSSKSMSPMVTSTPPGSNRSSGIFSEGQDGESQDNISNTALESSSSLRGSDSTLTRSNSAMAAAPSSISLDSGDSGYGHKRVMSAYTSGKKEYGRAPPPPPPRKTSFSGSEKDELTSPQTPGYRPAIPDRDTKFKSQMSDSSLQEDYCDIPSNLPTPHSHTTAVVTSPPPPSSVDNNLNTRVPVYSAQQKQQVNVPPIPPKGPKRSMSSVGRSASPLRSPNRSRTNSAGAPPIPDRKSVQQRPSPAGPLGFLTRKAPVPPKTPEG